MKSKTPPANPNVITFLNTIHDVEYKPETLLMPRGVFVPRGEAKSIESYLENSNIEIDLQDLKNELERNESVAIQNNTYTYGYRLNLPKNIVDSYKQFPKKQSSIPVQKQIRNTKAKYPISTKPNKYTIAGYILTHDAKFIIRDYIITDVKKLTRIKHTNVKGRWQAITHLKNILEDPTTNIYVQNNISDEPMSISTNEKDKKFKGFNINVFRKEDGAYMVYNIHRRPRKTSRTYKRLPQR